MTDISPVYNTVFGISVIALLSAIAVILGIFWVGYMHEDTPRAKCGEYYRAGTLDHSLCVMAVGKGEPVRSFVRNRDYINSILPDKMK